MFKKIFQTVIIVVFAATLGQMDLLAMQEQAQAYYVSPTGNDANDGTVSSPWQTVEFALSQLSPGDTLNLREGTYPEHEIKVEIAGTASAPILIRSYPGEQAIIDGSIGDEISWELIDANINLYRSQQTFPVDGNTFVRGWLVNDDVQLVEYESIANLESTHYGPLNGLDTIYVGPGLQLRSDGHIYIRLEYNPNDLTDPNGQAISPKPSDVNPNNNEIAIFFSKHILLLDGVSHVHFVDLTFSHSRYIMDVRSGSHHNVLKQCRFNFGTIGLILDSDVNFNNWEIENCEFNNGVPDYIYWTDVKNRPIDVTEAHPEFQSAAISGSMSSFNIHNNYFRNTFDGIRVKVGSSNTKIANNTFKHLRDDSITISRDVSDVEVAHNMMWHVMSGIANIGVPQQTSLNEHGPVYIHHNVIDNSAFHRGGRPGNYREDNWPLWTIGYPFPSHDEDHRDSKWKLYNNTIVSRYDIGHHWATSGLYNVEGNPGKRVYNNIFYSLDERVVFRDDLASFGSHYDGNAFYRVAPGVLPLFSDFCDGGRYATLADFLLSNCADWEINGLETDPGFDQSALNNADFDAETIWERYRPTNPELFTPGASFDGLTWPKTVGINYRGALPPSLKTYLPILARN